MKIFFYIRYYTKPGETLWVTGNVDQLGNSDAKHAFLLSYLNNEYWFGEIEVDTTIVAKIQYSYLFKSPEGETIFEGGQDRLIDLSKTGLDEIQLIDSWNPPGEYENVFYTDPFREVLLRENESKIKVKMPKSFTHIFRVKAPLLRRYEALCMAGSADATGNWKTEDPIMLCPEHEWWSVKLNLSDSSLPLTYKYGIYNTREKTFIKFEDGDNRVLQAASANKQLTIVHDGFIRAPNNTWKGAGVSIPVFSLRSKNSFGVGEFLDLKLLADWAKKTGLKLIQLLPVNDTISTQTWRDSYPYASISAFALHPIYLNLDAIAEKDENQIIKSLRKKQKQLNELAALDYEQVLKFKLSAAREVFQMHKEKFLVDKDFLEFFNENKDWLVPYAAFSYLRDRNGTADFSQWKLYNVYSKEAIEKYVSPRAKHYDNIACTYFIQYHLHLQLKDAVDYAHRNSIIIKGDIPIGVNRNSCDAWVAPGLYNMDVQAGAPPDDFAVKGQNWGFPTYNWEVMARDNFRWWRRRFEQMARYFDAFRIDHILGFFRIWSIPIESVQGIMGIFNPTLPIHVYEFAQRGMWFNYYRFCKPYITDAVLWELFGPNKEKFFPFLISTGNHSYALQEEYSTQRKVEKYFSNLEPNIENNNIRDGLYELISNVILFEEKDSNGQQFHFRISMPLTTSFRHLDWNIQQQLKAMYDDYFYHRQDEFWRKESMKKLPSLKRATNMLICGEDLGMVPKGVPQVMKLLGILSLEIQRMPKDETKEFFNPNDAPYLSVVTPSTHDMSTIRGWWEEDRDITQKFFNEELGQSGEAPKACEAWINKAIVLQHLYSPAMWSIFQLQDLMGIDELIRSPDYLSERINIPAIVHHYWRYRMHINLEDLLREKNFNDELKQFVEASGR